MLSKDHNETQPTVAENFGTSREKTECEKKCREPCEFVEYKTSLCHIGLQRDTFIEQLIFSLNNTDKSVMELEMYKPFLNMTKEQREKFIE